MREKLIELLGNVYLPMTCGPDTIGEYRIPHKFKKEIADHLIANGVTIQKWIPVSEPPKVHGKYLALTPSKIRRDGYVTWYIRYDPENGWYDSDPEWGDIEMDDVAYWMPTPPLPEPPKGE